MKFGASVWPWKWNYPFGDAVARIGKAGFEAVELIAWNEAALTDYYTGTEISHLRSVLADNAMVLSQFVVNNGNAASADQAERQRSVDMFKRGVDTGVKLGATIVNTVTHLPFGLPYPRITDRADAQIFSVDIPKGLDWKGNWEQYVLTIRECAEYAQQAGVTYSLEPHPFRYGANADGMLRILEAVDSPALGINYDPSHMFPMGEIPNATLYRLAGHVVHCHFSDNDGQSNVHWRPGKGKIDWYSVIDTLKDTGFTGVISLEFEDIPGVSRGSNSVPGPSTEPAVNESASAGFEHEYFLARTFLQEIADQVGL